MSISYGYAHDTDAAYFHITKEKTTIVVEAEFPWTIRNTLIAYDINFTNAKTEEEINTFFFRYAKERLKLFNIQGEESNLLKIILNKDIEHTHSVKYTLIYDNVGVVRIFNSLMFDYHKKQSNYHWITSTAGEKYNFVTSNKFPEFEIQFERSTFNKSFFLIVGSLLIVISILFLIKKNKWYSNLISIFQKKYRV